MLAPGERLVAVLDTCVLAPMPLCDTLLRLAEEPALYTPKWSADILRELRSTLQRMGYTPGQADRRIAAMTGAFEDAKVEDYEPLIDAMTNHPKDRHVLAAAVRCEAQVIITFNVKDFGPDSVKPHGLAVCTPDEFLVDQLHFGTNAILERLEGQATARGVALNELLRRLERSVPAAVQLLRRA
jgi:predicted nucleic acid-binding protein